MLRTGKQIVETYKKLETERQPWEWHWQELAEYIQPRKAQIESYSNTPADEHHQRLFDTTGVLANLTLARGQLAWMTPKDQGWFKMEPPEEAAEDEAAKNWCSEVTERTQLELANSNFYTEIHELYLDRGGFGTGAIYVDFARPGDPGNPEGLFFKCYPISTYVCAENARGHINMFGCKHTWTARNALEEFGEENLPKEVLELAKSPNSWNKTADYIWLVYPREIKARGAGDAKKLGLAVQMAYASTWVHEESGKILRDSGFEEMPVFVTRYLRWPRITEAISPYGWSPAWAALPDLKQLNHLEATLDALADRQVNPPILWPDGLEGRADLRPGGNTTFDPLRPDMVPREWMAQGRYDIGQLRAEEKRQRVRDSFMVSLFEMFQNLQDHKNMTATEVSARLQEKIDQFSPTFDLLSTELLQPLVMRVFRMLWHQGKFADLNLPDSMLSQAENGEVMVNEPQVRFTSRIALAIEATQDAAFMRTMEAWFPLIQAQPQIMDNVDWDTAFRDMLRHQGAENDWFTDLAEMAKNRQAQQEMMMQLQMAQAQGGQAA